jgi:general secretion pathway protein K
MAVVMAMAVTMLMVTVALELHLNERANMTNAAVFRDRQTLDQMTRSGIHLGMAMLIKDRTESESDSLQEDWADPDTIAGLIEEIPFEQGTLEVKIADELSKIQINALVQFPQGRQFNPLQQEVWLRLAGGIAGLYEDEELTDPPDPLAIINSIKDWLDSGDDDAITGLSGAETDYYEGLDPPYTCKNGPFDHLAEIELVKGITPELFNGIGGSVGLSAYLTVYGEKETNDQKFSFPGQVNINTAELAVLSAILPLESAESAPLLIEHREALSGSEYTHDLTQPDWYRNVPGLADATLNPDLVTISSDIFRISATATLNNVRMTTTAVVERIKTPGNGSWSCKVLNWQQE